MSEPHLPPGIYFNLDSSRYHADPALGSTSLKQIALDVYDWRFDQLYGEDKETDALIFGSALHARVLEGRRAFEDRFCVAFDASAYPDALNTVDEIKAWLTARGQIGLSALTKPKLIARVLEIDPAQPVLETLKQRWADDNAGKAALASKRWAQVESAAQWAQRDPLLSAVMADGTFSHGAPEVSVFYEDDGLRLKARFDRLLRHAIIDLKSFAPMFSASRMEELCIKAIARNRYDLQAAAYFRAWQKARELHAAGLVFGGEPFAGFLESCFDRPEPDWIWIFTKTRGAPQSLVVPWRAKMARDAAAAEIEAAIALYRDLSSRFGDGEWVPERGAFEITDSDLPSFFGR